MSQSASATTNSGADPWIATPDGRPPFEWPAGGRLRLTLIRGGGAHAKITFLQDGVIRAIGAGIVTRARVVPTGRIAQRYEVRVRHADGFESSYGIMDQTPEYPAGGVGRFPREGDRVPGGAELCRIHNGGCVDFQLSKKGLPADPRPHIACPFDGPVETSDKTAAR